MPRDSLLIVAGEASGDLHGARLLARLRELRPDLAPFGMGGEELSGAGLEAVAHSSEIAVIGITEVFKILPRARRIFDQLLAEVEARGTRTAILIDAPDFNLRLARRLSERGLRVVYYISPQVWAWRKSRVETIARYVDQRLVLLPFEVDFYDDYGIEAIHVGHPLVDEVPVLPQTWDVERAPTRFRISLLPGSRRSEVGVLLPILLEAASLLAERVEADFTLIQAPTIDDGFIAPMVEASDLEIEIVDHRRFEAIAASHLALCASGTATLEVGLIGTPMIVTHRVAIWSYLLGRIFVDLPYTSLVNLLLDREVVPELIQHHGKPERLAEAAVAILESPQRIQEMRAQLGQLRDTLGPPGASRRAAEEIDRFLEDSGA